MGVLHVSVCVGECVYVSVCACIPCGFQRCYRGNWMCDAHQKSPLALGKRSFNPSMPLLESATQSKAYSFNWQTSNGSLFSPSQPPSLQSAVASEEGPLTCNDMIVHMRGTRRGGQTAGDEQSPLTASFPSQ